jgi:hypothetical protein
MSATVAATVIAGFGGSFGLYWYQRHRKRQRIRQALIAELEATADRLDGLVAYIAERHEPSEGDYIRPSTDPFVTHAYDANVAEISLLSEPEVEAITDYYARVTTTRNMIAACQGVEDPPKQVLAPLGGSIVSLSEDRADVVALLKSESDSGFELQLP